MIMTMKDWSFARWAITGTLLVALIVWGGNWLQDKAFSATPQDAPAKLCPPDFDCSPNNAVRRFNQGDWGHSHGAQGAFTKAAKKNIIHRINRKLNARPAFARRLARTGCDDGACIYGKLIGSGGSNQCMGRGGYPAIFSDTSGAACHRYSEGWPLHPMTLKQAIDLAQVVLCGATVVAMKVYKPAGVAAEGVRLVTGLNAAQCFFSLWDKAVSGD